MSGVPGGVLVSVVVPVYDVEAYVGSCVGSLLAQTWQDVEVVLVDDGSTDRSGAVCDELARSDSRVRVVRQANGGLSAARNAGVTVARGRYVAFVDADDRVGPRYVERLVRAAQAAGADVAVCGLRTVRPGDGEPGGRACGGQGTVLGGREALLALLYGRVSVSACGKLFRRGLLGEGPFPVGRHFEDVHATYALLKAASRVVVLPEELYLYVLRAGSITTGGTSRLVDRLELAGQVREDLRGSGDQELVRAGERWLCFHALSVLRSLGERGEAASPLGERARAVVSSLRGAVLRDRRTPARDKAALVATLLGPGAYAGLWRLYAQTTGRGRP